MASFPLELNTIGNVLYSLFIVDQYAMILKEKREEHTDKFRPFLPVVFFSPGIFYKC